MPTIYPCGHPSSTSTYCIECADKAKFYPGASLPIPTPLEAVNPLLAQLEADRGRVYGDPSESHTNIGLAWTGLLQQHYGITLPHPLPNYLVAQMMVDFKMSRSTRKFQQDNYDDAHVYTSFAERFQRAAGGTEGLQSHPPLPPQHVSPPDRADGDAGRTGDAKSPR